MAQKEKKSLSEGLVKKAIFTPRQLNQAQDTLTNRGTELHTIVENNPDGLIVVSKDGVVLFLMKLRCSTLIAIRKSYQASLWGYL